MERTSLCGSFTRHLLRAKGLWGLVNDDETLRPDACEDQKAEFKKWQEKTFSIVALAISPAQLNLITSYDKPKPAWYALCEHFEKDTFANKLLFKKQYLKDGTSIENHMNELKEIADRLAVLGVAVSEEDQVVTLLGSLPPSFHMPVTTFELVMNCYLTTFSSH
uniref:Reverse transcriptase Ty1/copia-type domain-containing protein n=1 Tax=Amphimedon queenslandica TaxID=400682 RepID=A0A1X7UKX5_AMPQE